MRSRFGFLLFAAALTLAGPARADAHADSAAAFERGKALRDQGKFAEAAKEFKDSVEREKSVGGYYNLGLCLDKMGRYPEALKAYRQSVAIAQEKGDPRAKEALDAVQAVRNRTHWVLLNVRDDIAQTPGLVVEVDGREVKPDDYGVELFTPTAEHTLKVAARDYADLVVHPADRQPFTVDKLGKSLVAPPETPAGPSNGASTTSSEWGWQRYTGLALGVIGLGGLGFGGYTSLSFIDDKDKLQSRLSACKTDSCKAGVGTDYDDLKKETTLKSIVGYGGGALLIGAGIWLFVAEPGKSTTGRLTIAPVTTGSTTGFVATGSF